MLSNFAVSIIGVFVPLILFTYTGNMLYSLGFLFMQGVLRIVFVALFKKHIEKRPQLFLLLRVFPMLLYACSVFLLDVNIWLGIAVVLLFGCLSDAWSTFSNEVILNYSSLNRAGKSLGFTRVVENVGIIASVVAGGLFLDHVGTWIVIVLSIGLYLISVVPLAYYYIKFRNTKGFNKEAISNAFLVVDEKQARGKRIKRATKQILNKYLFIYVLMCFIDALTNVFNLYVFTKTDSYTYASLITASYSGMYGLSCYLHGKLGEKRDLTKYLVVAGVVVAASIAWLPFVQNTTLVVVLFGVIGFFYAPGTIFLLERMLAKTRILGVSNQALFRRDVSISLGKSGTYILAFLGGFVFAILGVSVVFALYSLLIPWEEEKTRKTLINFLEGN